MADDWRITVDFDDEGDGTQFVEWLSARRFESEERDKFGSRVPVSRDGPRVFLYADSEDLARDADGIVRALLSSEGRPRGSRSSGGIRSSRTGRTRASRCRRPTRTSR